LDAVYVRTLTASVNITRSKMNRLREGEGESPRRPLTEDVQYGRFVDGIKIVNPFL